MSEDQENQAFEAQEVPINILAQYVRDFSFENPNASDVMRANQEPPEMDINIGMDARKIPDDNNDRLYEVVLNLRAEASMQDTELFIVELQYGATVTIGEEIPEENHHPLLLIEIPRLIFPFARQIVSDITIQGGYPPLLLNPVDFHALYMQRFGKEIEEARAATLNEAKEGATEAEDTTA